jgi:hypothetical protein
MLLGIRDPEAVVNLVEERHRGERHPLLAVPGRDMKYRFVSTGRYGGVDLKKSFRVGHARDDQPVLRAVELDLHSRSHDPARNVDHVDGNPGHCGV